MKICHVAAELAPIAKIGGLADVVYGLGRETNRRNHSTIVIIPKYDILLTEDINNFTCISDRYSTEFQGQIWTNTIWSGIVGGLQVYFLEPHHSSYYFSRGCIYGCDDDVERFLYFSKAAWEFAKEKIKPDIIHIHDWQTAIIAPLAHREKRNLHTKQPSIVLTLHNVNYQGRCAPYELEKIGLEVKEYYVPEIMQDSIYPEALNLLQGGIVYADFITTVSPTYSEEIQQSPLGCGLENIIGKNKHKLAGILNGIDYEYWNPESDRFLPAHYSCSSKIEYSNIANKGYVKKILRERLMLEEIHAPIVGAICRLVLKRSGIN